MYFILNYTLCKLSFSVKGISNFKAKSKIARTWKPISITSGPASFCSSEMLRLMRAMVKNIDKEIDYDIFGV